MSREVPVNIIYSSKGAKQAATEAKNLRGELSNVAKGGKATAASAKDTASGLEGLKAAATSAAVGLAAIKGVEIAAELIQIGAAAQQAELALNKMSGGQADEYVKAIASASQYTITSMDAMSIAARSLRMGIVGNADEMARLTEIAMVMGQTMGISTTQALNDLSTGVARQSKLILDNLGILVNQEQIQAEVNRLMAEDATLTKESAQQKAWLNAVLAEGDALLAQTGGTMRTAATDVEVLKASWMELKTEAGKALAEVFGPAIENAAMLARMTREMKAAQEDFASTTAYTADNVDDYVIGLANAGLASQELAHQLEAGMNPAGAAASNEYAKLTEQFWELRRAEAEIAGPDTTDKIYQMARASEVAAESAQTNTVSVEDQEKAIREAEQAYQKYIQGLKDAHKEHQAIAGITADLVGQFDSLGKTFYSITPANNDAAAAAERYAENLANLQETAAELTYDIQFMGDGEGALQEKLNETNAVIAQQEAALNNAAAAAGNLQNVYTITQLTQEQMQLLGNSWIDVLETTGNELALTGTAYDNYRIQMGLATQQQIEMEAATRQIIDAMEQGTISATQAGDAYAAVMTGQAGVDEFIAQQEAANQQLLELGYTAESLGLADVYEGAQEPAANFAEQLGLSAEAAAAMSEQIPLAFESLAEVAPGANEALQPLALALQHSDAYIKGMIASAPEWAAALNEAGGALATEGSGVSLAASVLAGMQQDWRYLQNNPRLELEALVTITTIGGVGAAGGANFITNRPMMLPVGEIGPEKVTVEPLYNSSGIPKFNPSQGIGMAAGGSMTYTGSGGGGTTINIGNISLPNVMNARDFLPELERELAHQGKYIPERRIA